MALTKACTTVKSKKVKPYVEYKRKARNAIITSINVPHYFAQTSVYILTCSTGIENIIGGVLEVMKESTSIGSFKEDVEKLASDVADGLAIPPEQKDQVTSEIRQDIKETGTSSINSKCLHDFISDSKEM